MNLLYTLNAAVILVCLTGVGCGKDLAPAEVSAAPTNPSVIPASNTASNTGGSDTSGTTDNSNSGGGMTNSGGGASTNGVSITYYAVTKTIAPNSSFPAKTYTATGYCTNYLGEKYCWDNGKKTVVISGFSFYYSYFNMNKQANGSYSHSSGGMVEDLMVSPTIIVPLGGLIQNMASGAMTEVFNTGVVTTVDCTEASGVVTCPSFVIDSTQTAI